MPSHNNIYIVQDKHISFYIHLIYLSFTKVCFGEGNGTPLQYFCLENPMDREDPGGLQSMGLCRVGHD